MRKDHVVKKLVLMEIPTRDGNPSCHGCMMTGNCGHYHVRQASHNPAGVVRVPSTTCLIHASVHDGLVRKAIAKLQVMFDSGSSEALVLEVMQLLNGAIGKKGGEG